MKLKLSLATIMKDVHGEKWAVYEENIANF